MMGSSDSDSGYIVGADGASDGAAGWLCVGVVFNTVLRLAES